MTNMRLISKDFFVKKAARALNDRTHLWTEKTWRQKYDGTAHADTETVFIRWAPADTAEEIQQKTDSIDCPSLKFLPEIIPLIKKAMDKIKGLELGRVIVVSLKPGGKIVPHIDEGNYADKFERFHLCIQADKSEFSVSQGKIEVAEMKPGELWWFNHKRLHWAENNGSIPRIHMIIDCVAPKYRREREV